MAKILFVFESSPYSNGNAQDAFDFSMAAPGYGHESTICFFGDGLEHLKADGWPKPFNQKSSLKRIKALPLYDVENCYAAIPTDDHQSYQNVADSLGIALIDADALAQLIDTHDFVIYF